MKKIQIMLFSALMLCGCGVRQKHDEQKDAVYESADFTAVVISDLHYSSSPSAFNSIVPLEPLCKEVTDALIEQVIDLSPDAFILTGDNTNNGSAADVTELSSKLSKVREAGIEVIMTTGNHDYGQRDMKPYEAYFLPLLDMDEKDPDSYSYVTEFKGITVFSLDDSHAESSDGYFSEATMSWLKKQLDQAVSKHEHILFLSHHNILSGRNEAMYEHYLIQNEGLVKMLKEADVRLCMSGHQHNQAVYESEGMYEILNGMPFSSAHTFGLLELNDEGVSYRTVPIDFESYGKDDLSAMCEEAIRKQSEVFFSTFERLCDEEGLTQNESEHVMVLITRFFDSSGRGTLALDAKDILNDPWYGKMQEVLYDKNYGPWMEKLLKNPPADGSELTFSWK
ncbi:MAG: metallophosphoesterase [Erysipelotrichaceae bacterium]|nr:metallophosphoesterase [Erysipelotrichaceae bacterium]